jgi:hypothetical protein
MTYHQYHTDGDVMGFKRQPTKALLLALHDVLMAFNAIEHLSGYWQDVYKAFKAVERELAPKGWLVRTAYSTSSDLWEHTESLVDLDSWGQLEDFLNEAVPYDGFVALAWSAASVGVETVDEFEGSFLDGQDRSRTGLDVSYEEHRAVFISADDLHVRREAHLLGFYDHLELEDVPEEHRDAVEALRAKWAALDVVS